ncbi:MAG: TonB-dependent receptor [Candidatus Marinimicrobia bacterium]|nr:TonB-dependent receptor [Candidatus Neomarinimicrobiota bacterium]
MLILNSLVIAGTVSGKVTDENNNGLPGVNVVVEGTSLGASTDGDGDFNILNVPTGSQTITVSYIGLESQSSSVNVGSGESKVNFTLSTSAVVGKDVTVVGSRFNPRTIIDSPVPIDNISLRELKSTGQQSIDQMLTYKIPSYNSQQQTISDATAHFDPADLRGLGPSRTLVLVNGKRKNASSLVYINDTPGKGEVGVDMKSIPASSIERVEVLRDGASAQYGSDAIAGVVNIILKDDVGTEINLSSGQTTAGDGFNMGANVNHGMKIGDNASLNITASYFDQEETNRAGEPGSDALFIDLVGLTDETGFIDAHPDLGMHVGLPNMTSMDFYLNGSYNLSNGMELYSFGGVTKRDGLSYALYRAPYWIPDENNLLHDEGELYEGFQPTFETDITDNSFTIGLAGKLSDWDFDLSSSTGRNIVNYAVNNSQNLDMGADSPTEFNPGGYEFGHSVINFDVANSFGDISVGIGAEVRSENFVAVEGDEASYEGGGVQSFPGIQPQNAVDATRDNVGVYANVDYDVNNALLVSGAARFESYSDFGTNLTWKASTRYSINDDMTVRGSVSTGFRAPSLHQIYMSNIQTLVSGGTVSNQGTYNNGSDVVKLLGVAELKEENSNNMTFGFAFKPMKGLYTSFDYYNVSVDDRIVYSSSIASSDEETLVGQILAENDITSLKFFTNAVDTKTSGMDIVVSYSGLEVGTGSMDLNFSANFNETEIVGEIATPDAIAEAGVDIFDRKEQSRIESARPSDKIMLGLTYNMGALSLSLNNTRFGEVTWKHQNNGLNGAPFGPDGSALPENDEDYDQTFSAKWLTDVNLNYQLNDMIGFNFAINNLLDVYPDVIDTKGDMITDLGGRFKYPWEVNQFGFMGTTIKGSVSFNF